MKIDKKSIICGVPIIKIRDFLRRFRTPASFTLQTISEFIGLSEQHGISLLKELLASGYVEQLTKDEYGVTVKGNALALTKFVSRMNKKKADRVFSDFMKRVEVVNGSDEYLYRISKILLFGSYINPSVTDYGDIDIAYELERKIEDKNEFVKANQRLVDRAKEDGKEFSSIVEELFYSETLVLRYLKHRSPYISLHRAEEIEILAALYQQVFP